MISTETIEEVDMHRSTEIPVFTVFKQCFKNKIEKICTNVHVFDSLNCLGDQCDCCGWELIDTLPHFGECSKKWKRCKIFILLTCFLYQSQCSLNGEDEGSSKVWSVSIYMEMRWMQNYFELQTIKAHFPSSKLCARSSTKIDVCLLTAIKIQDKCYGVTHYMVTMQ